MNALLALLFLLSPAATTSPTTGSTLVAKDVVVGYANVWPFDVVKDGIPLDITGATIVVTVYRDDGTIAFTKTCTPLGQPVNRVVCNLTQADTGTPGTYKVEADVQRNGGHDPARGPLKITS